MGLFKKRNKKPVKEAIIQVSVKDLIYLLAIAIKEIDRFQIEYDIEFKQDNQSHKIGIDYDREHAPKKGYFPEYMSVYLDDQVFTSLPELCQSAEINGEKFIEIEQKFTIDDMYKDTLDERDIIK